MIYAVPSKVGSLKLVAPKFDFPGFLLKKAMKAGLTIRIVSARTA